MLSRRCLLLAVLFVSALSFAQVLAQAALPKEIAALLPKNAADAGGGWTAGPISMGRLHAELPANHPCTDSKTPGHLNVDIVYYKDKELVTPFQAAASEQEFAKKVAKYQEDVKARTAAATARQIRLSPVKTENVTAGKLAYYDGLLGCVADGNKERPEVELFAIVNTDRLFAKLEITGSMTADEARAVAVEVMTNLSSFSKTAKP